MNRWNARHLGEACDAGIRGRGALRLALGCACALACAWLAGCSSTPKPTAAPAAAPSPSASAKAPRRGAPAVPPGPSPGAAAGTFLWPAAGPVTTRFNGSTSKGIDIGGRTGEPVVAAAKGRVVFAGNGLRGYGNMVMIQHDSTYLTAYAHNSRLLVRENQQVQAGQKIAEMGDTEASVVALHFELRRAGVAVDPLPYLKAQP